MLRVIILWFILCTLSCTSTESNIDNKVIERTTEEVVEYYPNGIKKVEGEKVNGQRHGIWKYYYPNGFLWSEGKFWYGERKGYSVIYYKTGKKQMEGNYEKDLKVGKWKLWNPDGSLNKIVDIDQLLSSEDSLKLELKPVQK